MSDELEARLRAALAGRADELDPVEPDGDALERRRALRDRRRARRRGTAAGAVAAGLLLGGAWVAADPGGDDGGDVRAGTPSTTEPSHGLCDGPPSDEASIVLLDRGGADLVAAEQGAAEVEGAERASLYLTPFGEVARGVAVLVGATARASTGGDVVRLATGTTARVEVAGPVVRVGWRRSTGREVAVVGYGVVEDVVIDAAGQADAALAARPDAEVHLSRPPEGTDLVVAGSPRRVPEWRTSWRAGDVGYQVTTSTDGDAALVAAVVAAWADGPVGWAGQRVLLVERPEGHRVLWRRADGWMVQVASDGPLDDVAGDLCGVAQDRWPSVERRAAEPPR